MHQLIYIAYDVFARSIGFESKISIHFLRIYQCSSVLPGERLNNTLKPRFILSLCSFCGWLIQLHRLFEITKFSQCTQTATRQSADFGDLTRTSISNVVCPLASASSNPRIDDGPLRHWFIWNIALLNSVEHIAGRKFCAVLRCIRQVAAQELVPKFQLW